MNDYVPMNEAMIITGKSASTIRRWACNQVETGNPQMVDMSRKAHLYNRQGLVDFFGVIDNSQSNQIELVDTLKEQLAVKDREIAHLHKLLDDNSENIKLLSAPPENLNSTNEAIEVLSKQVDTKGEEIAKLHKLLGDNSENIKILSTPTEDNRSRNVAIYTSVTALLVVVVTWWGISEYKDMNTAMNDAQKEASVSASNASYEKEARERLETNLESLKGNYDTLGAQLNQARIEEAVKAEGMRLRIETLKAELENLRKVEPDPVEE